MMVRDQCTRLRRPQCASTLLTARRRYSGRRYLFIANSTGSVGIPDISLDRSPRSVGLSQVFDLALLGVVLAMTISCATVNGVRFCYGFPPDRRSIGTLVSA